MAYRKSDYRDLDKLRITRTNYNRRYYQRTGGYQPRKWTDEEIEMLFDNDISDRELSEKLGRSMKSIVLKRHRVRKRIESKNKIIRNKAKSK